MKQYINYNNLLYLHKTTKSQPRTMIYPLCPVFRDVYAPTTGPLSNHVAPLYDRSPRGILFLHICFSLEIQYIK